MGGNVLMNLREKVQKLGQLLQMASLEGNCHDVAGFLSQAMACNVYMIGSQGEIFAYFVQAHNQTEKWMRVLRGEEPLPEAFNRSLLRIDKTVMNLQDKESFCVFSPEENELVRNKTIGIAPLIGARKRLGSIVWTRSGPPFTEEEMILAECSATLVASEGAYARQQRNEKAEQLHAVAHLVAKSLSFSQLQAAKYLLDALAKTSDGMVVTGQIAEEHGVVRSVLLNSIRKLEGTGTLKSRSLGKKGTWVHVLNPYVENEINRQFDGV